MLRIGILALQGCVTPHIPHFRALGIDPALVRFPHQLSHLDGLVLPGGESTTMIHLLKKFDMFDAVKAFGQKSPMWGICAGSILMAEKLDGTDQESFSTMHYHIKRNAYGRQAESMQVPIHGYMMSFIRAPQITNITGKDVIVKAEHENIPVWIQEGIHMATTFHPELNRNFPSPIHQEFVTLVEKTKS